MPRKELRNPCKFCGRVVPMQGSYNKCDCYAHRFEMFAERFYSYTELQGECLEWKGTRNTKNYGTFYTLDRVRMNAHKIAWWLVFGEYSKHTLNHKCENPACVRVSHLEDLTYVEHAKFTHKNKTCPSGHTKRYKPSGWYCPTCKSQRRKRPKNWATQLFQNPV